MMKQKHLCSMGLAAGLALLLVITGLCAAAAEETAAELDNGVTWETTLEQVKAIEGVAEGDKLNTYSVGEFTQYGFPQPEVEGQPVLYIYYIFRNDQLVMYGASIDLYAQPDGTVIEDVYIDRYTQLRERLGEPADQDAVWFVGMFDILEEGAIKLDSIVAYDAWDLGNGSKLCLANAYDETVVYVYINGTGMTAE